MSNQSKNLSREIKLPIYLDYQSTTPMDRRVLDEMIPYFTTKFGNPHSRTHVFGHEAETAIENARKQVASLINAQAKDIIFTSGATESNNIALKGIANFYKNKRNKIIVLKTEHKCIIETARYLSSKNFNVVYFPVLNSGLINLSLLEKELNEDTLCVSVMAINNETGVIQPLEEIGKMCRKKGAFFHSDIAQAFGKIPIDVQKCNIDLASISGHKIYGPKGIGALYVRRKNPRVRISSIISGGGQERGMRSGTLPTPIIVGIGKAAEIAQNEMEKNKIHVKNLYDIFTQTLLNNLEKIQINGDIEQRYFGNANISFSCVEGESLILGLRKELAISSGSACTSPSLESSYVLKAMGIGDDLAHTSIRFGFGKFSTIDEIKYATKSIIKKVNELRNLSPLWEMTQEGIDINSIEWAQH